MSRNISRAAAEGTRRRRRRNSILLSVVAVAVIVVLLALEQVALLYLIATLGVAVLLVIVAFADLHGVQPDVAAPAPADSAAGIADRTASPAAAAATSFAPTASRPHRRKRRR